MSRIIQSSWLWVCVTICFGVMSSAIAAQEVKKQPKGTADEVTALIDRLTKVDQQDIGYSASTSGSAFLPIGQSEAGMMLLSQRPNESSDTLKSLVKLGNSALPKLLEHLNDKRPTKIKLSHGGGIGGMFIDKDEDVDMKKRIDGFGIFGGNSKEYTVMVGDLCYVAIGQIVNRDYWAVRYQPTNIILVTSAPKSKKLREDLIKEWGNMPPNKHRDSLARDLDSGNSNKRNGASLRLAYYYPTYLEPLAIKQLARATYKQLARATYSTYEVEDVVRFFRLRLYPAKTAKERKALVEEFVTKYGEIARDSVRWQLFEDLRSKEIFEKLDEKEKVDATCDPPNRSRECLIDVFGLPATVKSTDRPLIEPLSESAQFEFVRTLHYDRGEKLDRALRDLLAKTEDDFLAVGCLNRLVGRGYDAEIEAYIKRRKVEKDFRPYEAKLGWTRLHAVVDLDVLEYVEREIKDKVPVDAQGRDGRTALHVAAGNGKGATVKALLDAKANPNIKEKKDRLAVQLAAYEDHPDIVRLLIAKKSELPDVFVAVVAGTADRLTAIVKAEPGVVKLKNRRGLTPLHVAAREGQMQAVRTLIASKADVKAIDDPKKEDGYSNGWTPLHFAAIQGKTEVAAILLDHGADVNAADQRGKHTALHFAAFNGNVELVKLLLAKNADRDAKDKQNRTPLALAKEQGRAAVIKLLEK
jgi:ankyrin repeat protein